MTVKVRLMGTVRTFTPAVKALIRERIDQVAAGIAASHGQDCAIDVKGWIYPHSSNINENLLNYLETRILSQIPSVNLEKKNSK